MLGPSSKVIASSRRSRGPWLTSDPNQPALEELAPIQPVNPTTKITLADARSLGERGLGREARATTDAATADTMAHAVPPASADPRPPAARATTIATAATAATAAEPATAPAGRSRRGSVIP